MKFKFLLVLPLLFLSSCDNTNVNSSSSSSSNLNNSSITTTNTTTTTTTSEPTTSVQKESMTFDVYGINDFHGAVNCQYSSAGYYELGLGKLSTYLKTDSTSDEKFIISSGDMWQGSIESSINKGKYLTDAMNLMGFDSMTLGNHEFDWGQEVITENSNFANFDFLACNVVDRNGELIPGVKGSTIVTKNNFKVGIVGYIDSSCYYSITATMTEGLSFEYQFDDEYVLKECEKLHQQNVDFIILSGHSDLNVLRDFDLQDVINEGGIDLVLGGHSHSTEHDKFIRNDGKIVPVLNALCNGEMVSKSTFSYDAETDDVTYVSSTLVNFEQSQYQNLEEDPAILNLYKTKYDVDDLKNEVIGTIDGDLYSYGSAANLAASAIYDYAINNYSQYNIVAGISNQARTNIESGQLTYGELFRSFPFENELLIYKVDRNYLSKMYSDSSRFLNKEFDINDINFNETVYVCAIDYVALKDYSVSQCVRTNTFYRDVITNYIKEKGTIRAYEYDY